MTEAQAWRNLGFNTCQYVLPDGRYVKLSKGETDFPPENQFYNNTFYTLTLQTSDAKGNDDFVTYFQQRNRATMNTGGAGKNIFSLRNTLTKASGLPDDFQAGLESLFERLEYIRPTPDET